MGFYVFDKKRYFFVYNINKINALIKLKGVKKSFICEQLGLNRTYLADVERGKNKLTDERLAKIAEILGTTVEYLCDEEEPEAKEKAPEVEAEDIDMELYRRIEALPEDMRGWLMDTLDRLEGKK